jgi:hypothetical protein
MMDFGHMKFGNLSLYSCLSLPFRPKGVGLVVTLLTCIQEVLGWDTSHFD